MKIDRTYSGYVAIHSILRFSSYQSNSIRCCQSSHRITVEIVIHGSIHSPKSPNLTVVVMVRNITNTNLGKTPGQCSFSQCVFVLR